MNRYLLTGLLLLLLTVNGLSSPMPSGLNDAANAIYVAEKSIRTELYFGRNTPGGGTVSEQEWQSFVDEFITPRFPDGLTILEADGQWKGKDGSIAREQSKVIVLLYPRKLRKAMNAKIEEIRAEYKKRFAQESVMRIDLTKSIYVSY